MIPNWSPKRPVWTKDERALLPSSIPNPPNPTLATIMEKSENFPREFPIETVRVKTLKNHVPGDVLERNVNSVYPILHENILHLCAQFILHKRQVGTTVEKNIYKDMDLVQFIDRLLTKRAVSFVGKQDYYLLLDGTEGCFLWETVGTPKEKEPLLMKNCLSYDEIKLSAFLSVSSYTYFVNIGNRRNLGVFQEDREGLEEEGIIIGLIGTRLHKANVMEYQEIIVSKEQNCKENGYGNKVKTPTIHQLFAKFYEEDCLKYKNIKEIRKKEPQRFTDLNNEREFFDNFVFYKRLLFSLDTLFIEANQRALERGTTAYVHLVGIGLGVWKRAPNQNQVFMAACGERIKQLGPRLHNVSDICFSYMQHDTCQNYKHGDTIPVQGHPAGGIKIYICNKEPHSRLTGPDRGKLLAVSYAWDGNALPGNEFWNKCLGSSSDPAAACSTQVSELHNPFINPRLCANNLRVVTGDKVISFGDYVKLIVKD